MHPIIIAGIAVLILFALIGKSLFKQYQVYQWSRRLKLPHHHQLFQSAYRSIDGFTLSKQARQRQDAFEYTYGEIEFMPFIALLSLVNPDKNTRFYDLGSGTGKAVIAAAMVFPLQKACGIELFGTLHEAALKQQARLMQTPGYEEKATRVQFIQGDFLKQAINDATLIFINATALIGPVWDDLNQKLAKTIDCTIITISKPLKTDHFTLNYSTRVEMSWGVVTAYIQVRDNKSL